jgi:hypothetical protein
MAITLPRPHSAIGSPPGSEDPERGARAEMALELEGVVYRGVHAEEALGRTALA